MSIRTEVFVGFLETIHKIHSLEGETYQRFFVVQGETDISSKDYETTSCMAWSMDQNWESRSESRKTRMEKREATTRQCSTTERNLLHQSGWPWIQRYSQNCEKKFGKANGRSHAVQKGDSRATGNWLRRWLHLTITRFQKPFIVEEWNPTNPQGNEWNVSHLKQHEDHIVDKFIPMPQAMKITDAKAAVDKEWKKLETIPAWKLEKVKSKKEVILEAQRDKKKVHFATLMDICHSKNAELETKLQTCNGRVVLRGDIVKDDSGACAVFAELGLIYVPNDCRKSNGCYCKSTRLRRTSSWCSIRVHSSKIGGRSQIHWEHCDSLLNRSWMMSKYGICWLHRCTYRRQKRKASADHEFITLNEKNLMSSSSHFREKCREPCPQCSHTNESRVKSHIPTETAFLQDVNQFNEKVKLSWGSLIQKKLRD